MESKEEMAMAMRKNEKANTKKTAVKPAKAATVKVAKKVSAKSTKPTTPKTAKPVKEKAPGRPVIVPPHVREVIPVEPKPSARTCPLVLDGITAAEDFTTQHCFTCDEFDCRFYAAEERSGGLGSRLFAPEEGDDGFDDDDEDGVGGGFYNDAGMDGDDDYDYDDMR